MTTILSTQSIIDEKIQALRLRVESLKKAGLAPKMRVILVGNNPASRIYVSRKEKFCHELGCLFELVELDEQVSEGDFLKAVNSMNADESVTGCFVQLPVPKHLSHIDVTQIIDPAKDVDGFGAPSILELYKGRDPFFIPCTPKGILTLLESQQVQLKGKTVAIVGRSLIVGKPLSLLLKNRGATVTICHKDTPDTSFYTKHADIIVTAIGVPKYFGKKFFRNDQSQIVIDVGISKDEDNRTCGDVDFEEVLPMVKALTPVPGGVGPLTVFSLMENLIAATEKKLSDKKLSAENKEEI